MIKWLMLLIGLLIVLLLFLRMKKTSTAQIFQCSVGKFKVVALLDGYVDYHLQDIVKDDTISDHACVQEQALKGIISMPVNVYLIDTGTKIILVDVGLAGYDHSKTGFLLEALEKAGYQPDQITDILITHLHLDHIAGLLTKNGQKAFVNAQLYISKEDINYWIYEQQSQPQLASLMAKLIVSYALHGFVPHQKLFDGVSVVATPGHSVGHSSFLFESEQQKLFIFGDVVHVQPVQFMYPEISVKDDSDSNRAIQTRKLLFEKLSAESTLVAGAHLAFPGIGHVKKATDQSGYVFEPMQDN